MGDNSIHHPTDVAILDAVAQDLHHGRLQTCPTTEAFKSSSAAKRVTDHVPDILDFSVASMIVLYPRFVII